VYGSQRGRKICEVTRISKNFTVTMKCSYQSSQGILMGSGLASARHFCCDHRPPQPRHCSRVGMKPVNLSKRRPGWQDWPWPRSQGQRQLLVRKQVCHPVCRFRAFCCIKLIKKTPKTFQYKYCLCHLFALSLWEVQNKHNVTFLLSYNCTVIPCIYLHFM